jgi:hypothetical protein
VHDNISKTLESEDLLFLLFYLECDEAKAQIKLMDSQVNFLLGNGTDIKTFHAIAPPSFKESA